MSILTFKTSDLRPIVEHALSSEMPPEFYGQKVTGPSLALVGDQGVYLMSIGTPGQMKPDGKGRIVAYAEGINPDVDDDWYDAKHDTFGGDDGADVLPWAAEILRLIKLDHQTIRIRITDGALELAQ